MCKFRPLPRPRVPYRLTSADSQASYNDFIIGMPATLASDSLSRQGLDSILNDRLDLGS